MSHFDMLPDELVSIIMEYSVRSANNLVQFNPRYSKLYDKYVDDVIQGRLIPELCFDTMDYSYNPNNFKYPIDSLMGGEGSWDINNIVEYTDDVLERAKGIFDELSNAKIYYLQDGSNDQQSWIIVGKINDLYFCFEAHCDYTGFDCNGGGSFSWNSNWCDQWNKYMTKNVRSIMLSINLIKPFDINISSNDINYVDLDYLSYKLNIKSLQ